MSFSMRAVRGLLAGAVLVLGASSVMAANIAVVGGKTDDEFWSRIKKGVDDARLVVEKNGGAVSYLQLQTYDNLGPDAAQLVRTAISQGVTGIVVPDWVPEAEDEAIKAAVAAGIKVILMNAGNIDKARELGAINYVGSDEYTAGKAGGEYFASKGAKMSFASIRSRVRQTRRPVARVSSTASPERAVPASSCRCRRPASVIRRQSPKPSRRHCSRTTPSTASSMLGLPTLMRLQAGSLRRTKSARSRMAPLT